MELEPDKGGSSFYESFSDLIFATMAIFVLLMLIFLIQVSSASQAAGESSEQALSLQAQLSEADAQAKQAQKALKDARAKQALSDEELKEIAAKLKQSEETVRTLQDAMAFHPVEVVFVVDVSNSMKQTAVELRGAIQSMADVLPRLTSKARIGIVAYRTKPKAYPLTGLVHIKNRNDDNGLSYNSLDRWMSVWLDTTSSSVIRFSPPYVDIEAAIDMTLGKFLLPSDTRTRQVIVLMGDTGPWESNRNAANPVLASERAEAKRITDKLARWRRAHDNRSVIVHFARKNIPAGMPKANIAASQVFFQGLVPLADRSDMYSEDWSFVIGQVIQALLN